MTLPTNQASGMNSGFLTDGIKPIPIFRCSNGTIQHLEKNWIYHGCNSISLTAFEALPSRSKRREILSPSKTYDHLPWGNAFEGFVFYSQQIKISLKNLRLSEGYNFEQGYIDSRTIRFGG